MKTHCFTCLFLLTVALTTSAYAQGLTHPDLEIEKPKGPKPWTEKSINNNPDQFQFAIVTDRTGGHREGIFELGIEKLNLLQPEFVMSVGDLIEGYTTDTLEINRQWDEFENFVDALEMPFFYVPGNHDVTNPVMERIWKQRFGALHYSFVYKDVLFLAVNSEDQTKGSNRGTVSEPQLEWIGKTLDKHRNVKWTLLFMHQPLWAQQADPAKWFEVEKLLEDRKHTVFVGHRHQYMKYERNNSNYYILATTGGASSLRGPQLGEFDHVVWITMTEKGPIMANLQLEGIFDDKVYTEELSAFVKKVWQSELIKLEPLFVEGLTFKKDSIRLRLTNPFDNPVKIKIASTFSWDIKSDIPTPELTLPPNSVEFVSIELESRKKKSIEELKPLKVSAQVAVQEEGRLDYYIPFEFSVAPLRKYELIKASGKMKVDGDLSEWKELPYKIKTQEGTRFGVAYDKKYIYIGIHVNDSELLADSEATTFNQDFVGFLLDAQPTAKSAADRGDDWFKNSLYFIASPEDDKGKNSVWDQSEAEKSLDWKCVRNKEGYAFEVAVPISYVEKLQGSDWRTVRINIVSQDRDRNSGHTPRVTWQPNWQSANNLPGSGMFFRNTNERSKIGSN